MTNFVTERSNPVVTPGRFACLMPPYRHTVELLVAGNPEEAVLYLARESSYLLIDEIQDCLKRTMPVCGNFAILIAPFAAIATGISRELAMFLLKLIDASKLVIKPSFGWSSKLTPIAVDYAEAPRWGTLKVVCHPPKGPKIRRVPMKFVARPKERVAMATLVKCSVGGDSNAQ